MPASLKNKQIAAEETFNQVAAIYRGVVLTAFQNVADALRALQADRQGRRGGDRRRTCRRAQLRTDPEADRARPVQRTDAADRASRRFSEASIARVQSEAQLLSDTVLLFQALGGGWWNRPAARGRKLPKA